jgi:hypothetical protein
MIKKEYLNYEVISETDFIDEADGIAKVRTYLLMKIGIEEDKEREFPPIIQELTVINLNSQTGIEMDNQREKECIELVNKLNNQ